MASREQTRGIRPRAVFTVMQIFPFASPPLPSGRRERARASPRRDDFHPLSLFFYADMHLVQSVARLERVAHQESQAIFQLAILRVHQAQTTLLRIIYDIARVAEREDAVWASRTYRTTFPVEVQSQLAGQYLENILFAAEALSSGLAIDEGMTEVPVRLYEPAVMLRAAFQALRSRLHMEARRQRGGGGGRRSARNAGSYAPLVDVLKDFDCAWCRFEEACVAYTMASTSSASSEREQRRQMMTDIMSQGVSWALEHNILTRDALEDYEPSLMFAIPRLGLLRELANDRALKQYELAVQQGAAPPALPGFNIERSGKSPGTMRRRLSQLTEEEILAIARMLANADADADADTSGAAAAADGLVTLGSESARVIFKDLSGVADEIHSGVYAQDVVDALRSLFSMYASGDAASAKPTGAPEVASAVPGEEGPTARALSAGSL